MDHLPSILLELYTTVLAACVYLMRSTPYFLLYRVLFGLSGGSRNNCTLQQKSQNKTHINKACSHWGITWLFQEIRCFYTKKEKLLYFIFKQGSCCFSKTTPRLEEVSATPAQCMCLLQKSFSCDVYCKKKRRSYHNEHSKQHCLTVPLPIQISHSSAAYFRLSIICLCSLLVQTLEQGVSFTGY